MSQPWRGRGHNLVPHGHHGPPDTNWMAASSMVFSSTLSPRDCAVFARSCAALWVVLNSPPHLAAAIHRHLPCMCVDWKLQVPFAEGLRNHIKKKALSHQDINCFSVHPHSKQVDDPLLSNQDAGARKAAGARKGSFLYQ